MSTPTYAYQPSTDKFAEGMRKLKTAALLQIIASILVIGAVLAGYGSIFAMLGSIGIGPEHQPHPGMVGGVAIGAIAVMAVAALAGLVLGLVSTYGYLLPAASDFAEYDSSKYGTVATLLKVGYLGGIIAILGGVGLIILAVAAKLVGFLITGIIVIVIGLILFFIGLIGLILLMFKLREDTGDDMFLIAGILFIVGIFVNILTIVAWILVYVAAKPESSPLGRSAYRGSDELPPPPPA